MTTLLLHGLPFHAGLWSPLRAALGDPVDWIAPHLPGYGGAPPLSADLSIEAHLRWLRPQVDRLPRPLHLIGHEYGGLLAAALAAEGRADALSLLSTMLGTAWLLARLAAAPGLHHLFYQRYGGRRYRDRAVAPAHRAAVAAAFPLPGTVDFAEMMRQTGAQLDLFTLAGLTHRLRRASIPTQLLWGRADRTFPVGIGRRLARALPGAALHLIDEAQHLGVFTHPGAYAPLLAQPPSSR